MLKDVRIKGLRNRWPAARDGVLRDFETLHCVVAPEMMIMIIP